MPIPLLKLNTGAEIPAVGLGCWMGEFGREEAAYNMVKHALKLGYRHMDTATRYGKDPPSDVTGTEGVVGKAIRESGIPRSEIFVTTKLIDYDHDDPKRGFEESLKALDVDYIDLYLLHWPMARVGRSLQGDVRQPDESPTFVETWLAMEKLLDNGKVKSIGVSNFSIKNLGLLLEKANVIPAINQVELHPCYPQSDLVRFCNSKGIHLTAYIPLGQYKSPFHTDPMLVQAANELGKELSKEVTPSQLVLSWAVQRGTIVIPKSEDEARLERNFNVLTLPKPVFDLVDNYHKLPGMHRSLDQYTLSEPGMVGGWTYEQLGWSLDLEGRVTP